jgi:hypothetical protein
MKDKLKEILLAILAKETQIGDGQVKLFAELSALKLTLFSLDSRALDIFGKHLTVCLETFEAERRRLQSELELLQATVSKIVQ